MPKMTKTPLTPVALTLPSISQNTPTRLRPELAAAGYEESLPMALCRELSMILIQAGRVS